MKVLEVDNLNKSYPSATGLLSILNEVNFSVEEGESVSIVGSSGSGKTTLLGLCAGLDKPSDGSVRLFSEDITLLNEDQRAKLRNDHIGFIFQNFQLIPTLTALENVMIPLELRGQNDARQVAKKLLDRVGLNDRYTHYPSQLSGGEQQRVSLARAFSNNPKILFADEPTGNLDDTTSQNVEALLFELNKENKTTLIIVTHDLELAKKTDRQIRLKGGMIDAIIKNQHAENNNA